MRRAGALTVYSPFAGASAAAGFSVMVGAACCGGGGKHVKSGAALGWIAALLEAK
jgi:hypothetical protein